jgi:HEAT repeat protein
LQNNLIVSRELDQIDNAILKQLIADSVAERAAAVRALGVVGGDLAASYLVGSLFDRDAEVRRVAIEEFNRIGDRSLPLSSLRNLFDANTDEQRSEVAQPRTLMQVRARTAENRSPRYSVNREAALANVDCGFVGEFDSNAMPFRMRHQSVRATAQREMRGEGPSDRFFAIIERFDDPSPAVRKAAALELSQLDPDRTAELFKLALEMASPERKRNIEDGLIASGLAAEAIDDLSNGDRVRAYRALCLLHLMARCNAVQPLLEAIAEHEKVDVRRAVIRVLDSAGHRDLAEIAVRQRLGIPPR